ncbi:hypothetical protein Rsub_04904 [Raphidocelis subcapitata]|uniref:Uncharacterized protein n=1 Tax=Raphidocelis subcapitata TaxID=307507 RepID=A0A2V0NWT5_9CHLO|nr:hypothetical protein Rsub_04904 [Raphidocelis subcapitata]|eukprot:GBF91799.1 hypothetical protein Rsub_04904 [Raphidocelis subcapitata]
MRGPARSRSNATGMEAGSSGRCSALCSRGAAVAPQARRHPHGWGARAPARPRVDAAAARPHCPHAVAGAPWAAPPPPPPPPPPPRSGAAAPNGPAARRRPRGPALARAAAAGGGGASGPQPQPPQPPQPPRPADLSGLWAKDEAASDLAAYERSLDLLGLSGLQKLTAKLIDGMEIRQARGPGAWIIDPGTLVVSYVTVVPFFRVRESFPLGATAEMPRRDLRPGRQTALARRVEGGARVEMAWGEPLAGSLVEEYTLLPDGRLRVRATTAVGGRSVTADAVYARARVGPDELVRQREAARRRR